ncbi:TPA: hypothetical protein ACX6RM_003992 [Photobacterium damselae]
MRCLVGQVVETVSSIDECFLKSGEVIVSAADVPTFNTEFFVLINGFILFSFITGHFSGRLVRWMNKI